MSRLSLRAAIDAKCKSCIYDPGSGKGGWREQVADCCSSNCPLHEVRPLPVKATKSRENMPADSDEADSPADCKNALERARRGRNGPAVDERRAG